LFLLERFVETDIPIPEIQLRCGQLIRLLQAEFALEVDLGLFFHAEFNGRTITAYILAEARDELFRTSRCLPPRNLEVHGSFEKGTEKIALREKEPGDSSEHPQDKRALL